MSRAGHTRNLFQTGRESERVVRPVAPVALEFVGETRYVVTEAGERHCVIDAVVTLAADPVRQIHHEVHVREDVRVFHVLVAECRVVLVLAALNLQAGTHYGVEPFGQREVGLPVDVVEARRSEIVFSQRAVEDHNLGASGDGDFPVVEETVGFVTGPASSLGLLLFYDDFFCDSDNLG